MGDSLLREKEATTMRIYLLTSLLFSSQCSVDAFYTEKCDHASVTSSLENLLNCKNNYKTQKKEGVVDFCHILQKSRECVFKNLKKCFKKNDIERTANKTVADIEIYAAKLLSIKENNTEGHKKIETFFASCPNVPDKEFIDSVRAEHVAGLNAVFTDRNCSKEDLNKWANDLQKCVDDKKEELQKQSKSMSLQKVSVQESVCSLIDGTIGKCFNLPLPHCLVKREQIFLEKIIKQKLHEQFKIEDELIQSEDYGFSFAKCSIVSTSNQATSFSRISSFVVILAVLKF